MSKYKGDLTGFPTEVVQKMLYYQEKQGHPRDITVFQHEKSAGRGNGGFTWSNTEEGRSFWNEVISNENFDVFFKKYPVIKGYKFRKDKYAEAAKPLLNIVSWNESGVHFSKDSKVYAKLKDLELLYLWCEPVYDKGLPEMHGYEGKILGDSIQYGCAELTIETLKVVHRQGFTLNYKGREITSKQIQEILEYVDRQN